MSIPRAHIYMVFCVCSRLAMIHGTSMSTVTKPTSLPRFSWGEWNWLSKQDTLLKVWSSDCKQHLSTSMIDLLEFRTLFGQPLTYYDEKWCKQNSSGGYGIILKFPRSKTIGLWQSSPSEMSRGVVFFTWSQTGTAEIITGHRSVIPHYSDLLI